jgi:ubiquinone/menaquinone biosynthesis C-methylase UbiE
VAQNIYDNADFFEGYARLPRSLRGLDGAPEWSALESLLPDVRGLSVVDLGCGYGWFCRWVREHGAARVLGLDLSDKMLERAGALTSDAAIEYTHADLDRLELPASAFGLAVSSLTLHYIEDLDRLLDTVWRALLPGARLVLSVEHPIYTAPTHTEWLLRAGRRLIWPVDGYSSEGPRTTDWLVKGVVKQHRTIATYLNSLIRAGFGLSRVIEWAPSDEQIASWPKLSEERDRPMFLLLAAQRIER